MYLMINESYISLASFVSKVNLMTDRLRYLEKKSQLSGISRFCIRRQRVSGVRQFHGCRLQSTRNQDSPLKKSLHDLGLRSSCGRGIAVDGQVRWTKP